MGPLILSVLAAVLDRVNLPQKPLLAPQIVTEGDQARRDRTGTHIVGAGDDTDPTAQAP